MTDEQSEAREKAIDKLLDDIVVNVSRMVSKKGGNSDLFLDYLSHKEVIGEIYEGLMISMPENAGETYD